MLTERAKLLIFLLAACLVLAWYTQLELIYLISAILASILLVSFLFFHFTLINLKCTRQMPNLVYENETINVSITLENRSIFAAYFIQLSERFPADLVYKQEKKGLFLFLPKRAIINWTYQGLCFKRGIYWVGPLILIGSDPLGLFKKYKIINISSKLTVYPRIFKIHHLLLFRKGIVMPRYGSHTSRRSGDYEEFYGIREYRQEDGLRKIHWPSTAKHNQLIVRHFEQSCVDAVTVILDLKKESNLGFGKETTLEYAVKIAASLSKYFLDQGSIVQLLAYADKPLICNFGHKQSHFFNILESLTQMQATGYHSLGQALTILSPFIPAASTLVLIRLDNDLQAAKTSEQFMYTKHISIIEVQLMSSSFDRHAPKYPAYYIQTKTSDIRTYQIPCGASLETSFNQA